MTGQKIRTRRPATLALVCFGAVCLQVWPAFAQEEAAAHKALTPPVTNAATLPAVTLPTATPLPTAVLDEQKPPIDGQPLRNIDLLNKMDNDRLPTSPRRFLKIRFKQVRHAKDQKILQLLLVCVGFVGAFIAILALRSVPPGRPAT